jgi:hypothetical protein
MARISGTLRYTLVGLLVMVGGCSSIFGDCEDETKTLDAMYGTFYDVAIGIKNEYERQGYDCSSTAIRNASGSAVGEAYTCTKCD